MNVGLLYSELDDMDFGEMLDIVNVTLNTIDAIERKPKIRQATQADFDARRKEVIKANEEKEKKALEAQIKAIETLCPDAEISPEGIYYTILKEGTGEKCGSGKNVATHYKGYFLDGTVFDSSEGRGTLDFTTNARQMIPGFDIMVQDMKVGEKRTVVLPPDYAYGKNGYPGVIPPNSYLAFDIELVSIR